jgi:cytochrome c oxidase subunit IV
MGAHSVEEVSKQVKIYIFVFVALAALTVVTVAVSYLHLSTPAAIFVAMVVAITKGTLVAGYFMHLFSEKKLIYAVLLLTVVFFFICLFLPVMNESSMIVQ